MPKTLREKHDEREITMAITGGCVCLFAASLSPVLTFLALSGIATSLTLSLHQWSILADLTKSQDPIKLTSANKILIGIVVGGLGLSFLQVPLLGQILLCTGAGTGLTEFYLHQCILASQKSLNSALRRAVGSKKPQLKDIRAFLNRGADPFAPDKFGNTAFHYTVQESPLAETVLNNLAKHAEKKPPSFKKVLKHVNDFFSDNIRKQWSDLWEQGQHCIENNTASSRDGLFKQTSKLLKSYVPVFKKTFNTLTGYSRGQFAYPKNIACKNNNNETPSQMIASLNITPQFATSLKNSFKALAAKPCFRLAEAPSSEFSKPSQQPSANPKMPSAPRKT